MATLSLTQLDHDILTSLYKHWWFVLCCLFQLPLSKEDDNSSCWMSPRWAISRFDSWCRPISSPSLRASASNFHYRAIFVWPWKKVSVSARSLFHQPMDEKIKTWPLCFPAKETLIWRRHCSIGQSCCSMTSKPSIGWFLESSRAWSFFTWAFA